MLTRALSGGNALNMGPRLWEGWAASFVSLGLYGRLAWRCWADYRRWLAENVTDAVDFDPGRNYFDQFWLYVIFSGLVIYLGVEGWR
ncbi:hypothetical protein, partial [Sandarakinorhabdus sp.]|uniref:hypothetical protein n=1 Tax=Sandarakinorhabdus sp. TaxID=1916663 RepID=UPI00356940E2